MVHRIGQVANDNSWLLYPAGAGNTAYTANNLNQYTAVGAASPSYDGDGNLTSDGTLTYGYDAESRLLSIKQGATTLGAYAYDAQGRRKSKTAGGATTIFVTDADNREVLEYDGASGAAQRWYAYGPGPNAVLNQMNVVAATRATLIPDIQGSVIGSLDSGGTLTKIGYQPFGEHPGLTSGGFRYTGQRQDPETAGSTSQPSGLYYYRSRIYSPGWGRFLQPDAIGYAGGNNLYTYVNDDPLDNTDPTGWRPGDPYPTSAAAGVDAIFNINPRSIDTDTEYAGRVYYNLLGGYYSYTAPTAGNSTSSNPGALPFLAVDGGEYHTHGSDWAPNPFASKNGEVFSIPDMNRADAADHPSYLGTPSGLVEMYTPNGVSNGGTVSILGSGAVPLTNRPAPFLTPRLTLLELVNALILGRLRPMWASRKMKIPI